MKRILSNMMCVLLIGLIAIGCNQPSVKSEKRIINENDKKIL